MFQYTRQLCSRCQEIKLTEILSSSLNLEVVNFRLYLIVKEDHRTADTPGLDIRDDNLNVKGYNCRCNTQHLAMFHEPSTYAHVEL